MCRQLSVGAEGPLVTKCRDHFHAAAAAAIYRWPLEDGGECELEQTIEQTCKGST